MRKCFIPVFLFFLGFVLPHMAIAMEVDLVKFSISSSRVDEGDKSIQLKVERTVKGSDSAPEISVDYRFVTGQGATSGMDYDLLGDGILTWGENDTDPKFISIKITDDLIVESEEAFVITLFNCRGPDPTLSRASSSCSILTKNHTVTIIDNDFPGEFVFESVDITTDEGKVAHITVNRINGADGAVSVDFQTIDGSASSGSDYTDRSGTLSWNDQEDGSKTFDIPILKDLEVESQESFEVQLFNASNHASIKTGVMTVSITDATEPGTLSFTKTVITAKEGDQAIITVTRNNGTDGAVSVNYKTDGGTATADSDYTSAVGILSWGDQEGGSKTFNVSVLKDLELEPQESFSISLLDTRNEILVDTATVNINDSTEPGDLSFASTVILTKEGGIAKITVARNNGTDGTVSVDYQTIDKSASAGSDYKAISGTFSWSDKEGGSKIINVPILKDTIDELVETFEVTLSNATNGATVKNDLVEVSINDTIHIGELVFDNVEISVDEGDTAQITVSRINGADGAVSVSYQTSDISASAGSDYVATSGTLSWNDQESGGKTFEVKALSDTEEDASEVFSIRLSDATGGVIIPANTAKVNILDTGNDIGILTLTKNTESIAEGSFLKVEVMREGGVDGDISVDYATSNIISEGSNAVAGVDYTPVSGTLNWSQGDGTTKIVRVPIKKDFTVDTNESFLFALSNVQGTTLGNFQQMTVTIENTQSSLEELPGLSPEQKQMAQMLTGACDGAFGDLSVRCTEILQGEFAENELKDILQQLLPTEVGSMGSTGITLGTTQLKNLMQRLGDLRRGQRGFSADGLTANIQGESLPIGKILTSASGLLGGGASSDIVENERFGFFIHGKINVGDKDQTDRETGFEFSTQGVTVGMDYRFNDELVMGTAFGYGHTNTRYDQSRGEMDANAISASFYGSYYLPKSFYVDWILAYGFHDYEADRNIRYDGTDYAASSTPEGNAYDVAVSFGKDINWQQWQLNSYARLEYQVLDIEGYQESGGHGFALKIGEQAVNSFTTVLGGQLAFNWSQSWGVLSPAARFEWEHQYMNSSRNITASFVNSSSNGGVLSIATENVDRNYFNIGASLNATFDYGRSAFVMYETRLGQNDISSHMVEIGVRIPF